MFWLKIKPLHLFPPNFQYSFTQQTFNMKNFVQLFIFLSFVFSSKITFCQDAIKRDTGINLVPNPSFENLKKEMPELSIESYLAFRNHIANWNSPTQTTPDLLFNINDYTSDKPRTGSQMIGILTHNPNSKNSDTWREYIQVKLDLDLEQGEEYILEFWVKRHGQAVMASNNIGALLSRVPFINDDIRPITALQLVANETKIINPKKPKWQKISATFTADGDERFLIIGNFFDNENTTFKDVKNTHGTAWHNPYYILDDVSLRQIITIEPIVETLDNLTLKKGDIIRLDRIFYDFDKWDLLPASFEQLDELVTLLNKYPSMRIVINGHTDDRGSDSYNELLSDNRCQSVYNYLISNSIDSSRLEYKGYGEIYPIALNTTDEGRQQNRRVQFEIIDFNEEDARLIDELSIGIKKE
jgi:outer membrane protein OmpA-like peptidoglycan-associated protein